MSVEWALLCALAEAGLVLASGYWQLTTCHRLNAVVVCRFQCLFPTLKSCRGRLEQKAQDHKGVRKERAVTHTHACYCRAPSVSTTVTVWRAWYGTSSKLEGGYMAVRRHRFARLRLTIGSMCGEPCSDDVCGHDLTHDWSLLMHGTSTQPCCCGAPQKGAKPTENAVAERDVLRVLCKRKALVKTICDLLCSCLTHLTTKNLTTSQLLINKFFFFDVSNDRQTKNPPRSSQVIGRLYFLFIFY